MVLVSNRSKYKPKGALERETGRERERQRKDFPLWGVGEGISEDLSYEWKFAEL